MSEPHPTAHVPHLDGHTLTKKLGPFPVWAWGAGIGAVLVIFLWMHNRDNNSPVTAYDNTAAMDGIDDGLNDSNAYDDAYQSGFSAGAGSGGGGSSEDTGADDATDTNPDGTAPRSGRKRTNDSWLRRAAAALVADGRNPLRVSRILNRYLNGQGPRNRQERRIVNEAIRNTGLPPDIPKNVSGGNHHQQATGGAHGDHPVQPHTSNAQPHHGQNGGGWPTPPRPHQGQQQHRPHRPHHHAGQGA